MKSKKKKLVMLVVCCVMVLATSITVFASAPAALYSNEYSKSTACVGNSNGCFYWWGSVGSTSKYNVQFIMYGGTNSNSCSSQLKSAVYAPGETFSVSKVEANIAKYSVGKVTMYGNNLNNQKKDCIASVGINGTN